MCGIVGIIRFDEKPIKKTELQAMMQVIKHRGPDDEGVFIDGHVGLGHVRLSILDLSSAGKQPMTDPTGRYTIIQNGESYNYIELREELQAMGYTFKTQTDTEVVLNGYIAWGEKVLDRLNGMFARICTPITVSEQRKAIGTFFGVRSMQMKMLKDKK